MLSCDEANVVLDTVKMSEDKEGVIVRLYETHRKRTSTKIKTGFAFKKAYVCDLEENILRELSALGNEVEFLIKPYEIITIKFVL